MATHGRYTAAMSAAPPLVQLSDIALTFGGTALLVAASGLIGAYQTGISSILSNMSNLVVAKQAARSVNNEAEPLLTETTALADQYQNGSRTRAFTLGLSIAFVLLAQTLKTMSVGTAYAIWSGLGTATIAVIGMIFLGEAANAARIVGIVLVIADVVLLNLGGAH